MNREYTDKHPNEPCTGCKFNIYTKHEAKCSYRSNRFWCYRDEIWAKDKKKDNQLTLF